jgi:hypothetical protein
MSGIPESCVCVCSKLGTKLDGGVFLKFLGVREGERHVRHAQELCVCVCSKLGTKLEGGVLF